MAREKLAWAEAQASASLAQKEQEWEARIDTATSGAHQEASGGFRVSFSWLDYFCAMKKKAFFRAGGRKYKGRSLGEIFFPVFFIWQ